MHKVLNIVSNLVSSDSKSVNFGDIEVNVDYGKKENRERPADTMSLKEFLKIYNETNQYLVDSMPDELKHQFQLPPCILCGGFTDRLAVLICILENLICLEELELTFH